MKLDFEKVEVTGYTDANIRAAVVGDTTILIVKDYTGQMSVTGFKTPELVIYKTSAVGPTESIDPGFLKSIEELATEAGVELVNIREVLEKKIEDAVVKSAAHETLDALAEDIAARERIEVERKAATPGLKPPPHPQTEAGNAFMNAPPLALDEPKPVKKMKRSELVAEIVADGAKKSATKGLTITKLRNWVLGIRRAKTDE